MVDALLEGAVARGYREPLPKYRSVVQMPGTAMNVVSVTVAVGVAEAIASGVAWEVCPVAAVLAYLGAETLEQLLAERLQAARGVPDADAVSDEP